MFTQKPPSRNLPGILSYMEFFSSKKAAYSIYFGIIGIFGFLSFIFNVIYTDIWNFIFFLLVILMFIFISGTGILISVFHYSKRAPILAAPPKGWAIQLNAFLSAIIGISLLIGQVLVIFLRNIAFQEVFFILGTIVTYIIGFVIYYSFTTVGNSGSLILALTQPVVGIFLYSIFTAQISIVFFIKAIIFFCSCAFIFAIPYSRSMSHVSDIYREATGIGGYPFIRAFILSMMTEGNDQLIESFFDKIGVVEDVKIQYLAIRTTKEKKLKGLFFIPNIHFGPFKTCGSSDLPEHIYKEFEHVIGTTVYHTTNDHTQNLTSQQEVDKVLDQIRNDINKIESDDSLTWTKDIKNVTRKISNSAKLIGTVVDNTAIIFVTRHPLPSDDIQAAIGDKINQIAKDYGYNDIIIIDSHNSIIGDEILIRPKSFEAKDIISVSEKFLRSIKKEKSQEGVNYKVHYGVVRDSLDQYDEKDGIGYGGLVVHMFKDTNTNQKTVFIHFDGNNAYVDIRSYILNMLQNRGIERGEVTTSDSHTVARKFTKRAYSPIGEKIKLQTILEKLDMLLPAANQDLQEVEFCYYKSIIPNIKIWGDPKYFDVIMNTLQECIRISQRLLTLSLILPTFFSLILLLFFYQITDVFNIF
ncbi:MAG: DUF2070 family protein [Promethearchaeota archaeon]|nr:MAG: DUF2070 family protein [Candidatus Lokiarchaeota archaeon]